ncbi:hybrid sensor histidine kinase/response regulator transcription factor [Sunxiuqinia sp. A32]|uniref:hybrid sensor histidine kinase/response regulator transcription factor n=1 Tax=Sunxiuqinia sp. A32 TaxID=3461496 RepID=UPI0040462F88
MKYLGLFIVVALFLSNSNTLFSQEKTFRHITVSEGLSYNTVNDIEQDKEGFIWIASGDGLNRYDSYGFKTYYTDNTENSIPSNEILSLLVTKKGTLFVGTPNGLCIYNPQEENFTRIYFNNQPVGLVRSLMQSSKGKIIACGVKGAFVVSEKGKIVSQFPFGANISKVVEANDGSLWAHKRQQILHFNENGKILKTYTGNVRGLPHYIPSPISDLMIDSKNRVWVGTFKHGPLILDLETESFKPIPLKEQKTDVHPMYFVRDMYEDTDGRFWIGTEKGLFIYDLEAHEYEHYLQSFDHTVNSLNDNAVYKIFKSRENIMWIGTYFGGLNIYNPNNAGFSTIKPGIKPNDLKGKALSQIIKGPDNKLWLATEDAGIAIYDLNKKSFSHILNTPQDGAIQISSNVHALTIDRDNNVWSGNFFGGINCINPKTLETKNYSHIPGNPQSLTHNFVFSLYCDSADIIWVGTMVGVDCYDKTKNIFTRFKPKIFRGKFIYDIFQDNKKNYWFSTYNNQGLFRYNPQNDKVTQFQKDSTNDLQSNTFICHCIASDGKIWFGTKGGGISHFNPEDETFKTYTTEDGLPNNVVYGILEDSENNFWISTNKGICKFNFETGEIRNFTVDNGLVGNQFNFKSYYKADDGTMYFGAVNGLTYFNPKNIQFTNNKPVVHFTDFKLFNQSVEPGENSALEKDIDITSEITLKHNQNVIGFDFIALDFYSKGKNNFFYYMEGFDSDWQSVKNSQSATYTNLSPGEYTFKIKATNSYNFPNDRQRSIKLIILPPFTQTIWAYMIYALILAGIVFLLYHANEVRHKEKMVLKIEKIEKAKLREIHKHKINFFTYISHEFKTPLTIILATLDGFFNQDNIPDDIKNKTNTLRRNALRLQFLINQLMDFRKIETDHAQPNLQSGDIIQYLKEVFEAYNTLFNRKGIDYIFISERDSLNVSFDPDKIEKIVSNLLSNAFKFTPRNGVITLKIATTTEEENSMLKISVSDTGPGMNKKQLDQIFNLFYKSEDENNEYHGSGIGLTLTQSLVKFLNGTISVESKLDEGTTFTVKLPYTEIAQDAELNSHIQFNKSMVENLASQTIEENGSTSETNAKQKFEILFVEDNKELLTFLYDHFCKSYKVHTASNGEEALKTIKKHVPDLIVTDLMMPKMDGITLCKEIKTNFEFCHIPILMLTSKSDVETRIESFEVGADHYVPKPFILSELELRIRNILLAKSNLKKHFIKFGNLNVDYPIKNRDQHFIEKITSIVLENIENTEFGVSSLTKELGIGRTLLHNKLKQILDLSTTEFINTIRIKEAQKLLIEEPELTMSEVAYKVGFNDPNYFSRTFKKIFEVSPSSFRTKQATDGASE